ncbi:penicillin-binding protein 1A [Paenibacillus lemnae]|uniref:Carboxypeptidase n=1 Tax=Paenibacillus lemnae TaxID=1330551 RepID=A0A848M3K8_PAELE|nr:penicillin-binding protein 1A [Paenibacillus lemnae]NMO94682.1 carboxypeptidase [Paenibacillus lemnae]
MVEEKKHKPENEQPSKKKKSVVRKIGSAVGWLFILGLMGMLFAGGAIFGYITSIVKDEPVRSRAQIEQQMGINAITGFAYFGDGSPIGQLRTEEDRRPVKHEEIPQIIIDAVVSIEDNRFFTHEGVDMVGTTRAVKQRLLNEQVQTGGSTLTQQLARQVFLSRDRTANRKVKEILLALRLERFMTKNEIITAYLNKVPYGNGSNGYNIFGIKAAAKGIFNINDLNKLNIAQAAYLAGLPQLPSAYSAFSGIGEFDEKSFNRALKRQALVLQRMLDEGVITDAEYKEAKAFDIKSSLAPRMQKAYVTYPYLMMEVERQASKILMELNNPEIDVEQLREDSELEKDAQTLLSTGGYRIYTTIDRTLYGAMRKIAENDDNFFPDSEDKGKEQTAAMMIDNKTGAILGMIEGRDYQFEAMNYSTQMKRQPGSAMKPIAAYLPALESGQVQPGSIVDDSPIILKDGGKGYHIPKNVYTGYKGLMTAREALNNSTNTVALKLFNNSIGIDNAWEFARKLGITTLTERDSGAATGVLGGLEFGVTVEELTNAYSSIGNQGKFADAFMISKIVDSNGKIVYKHDTKPVQVYSEQTAYLMTDMMRTVITEGSGSTVRDNYKHFNDIPVVGKTGSSQNYGDSWFVGLSPDVTVGVWVGYKYSANTLERPQRTHAQNIWSQIMNEAIDLRPKLFENHEFAKPEDIVSQTVSAYSGKLPSELTDRFVTDLFNAKYVPTERDDSQGKAKYITYRGVNYIPRDETPNDFLKERTVIKREKPIDELIKELEAAFAGMTGDHEPLSYYIPRDANKNMPTKVDPRIDDGRAPTPPKNVRYSSQSGNAVISFSPSGSPDVVGYRLYRSVHGGSFVHGGQVVTSDGPNYFVSSSGSNVQYYIVAVDVAGKTSSPSAAVGPSAAPAPTPTPSPAPTPKPTPSEPDPADNGSDPDVTPDETVPEENQDQEVPVPEGPSGIPKEPRQPAVRSTDSGFKVTWKANPAEDQVKQYNVYASPASDGVFQMIGSSSGPEFNFKINDPIKGTFRITAVNEIGESSASASVYFEKE